MEIIAKTLARYRVEVVLAVTLLLLGAATWYGATRLQGVIVRQERTDTAAAICATLQSRQYDALAAMIDPAPVAPGATQPFDRTAFVARLRTLEQRQGAVTSCAWRALQLDDESATYLYAMRRPHTPVPIGMLVVLRYDPDSGWRISRRSPFTSDPV